MPVADWRTERSTVPPRAAVIAAVGTVVAIAAVAPAVAADPTTWASATLVATATLCATVWYVIDVSRRRNEVGVDTVLTPADGVTLFRGVLVCGVAGFALSSPRWVWLPAGLFVLASLLDAADGALARRIGSTPVGRRLDGAVDALCVLLGAGAAVALGGIAAWYLLAGVVWYGFAGSLRLRRLRGKPVYALPASRLRRPIGAAQLVVIAVALTPVAPHSAVTATAAVALLALAASFARDWTIATGRRGESRPRLQSAPADD